MQAKIVAAFTGTGKTRFRSVHGNKALDLDSSAYSSEENFPYNYLEAILNNLDGYDYILISTHSEIRNLLGEENIEYSLVFPKNHLKNEYIKRLYDRGSSNNLISFISDNWDSFMIDLNRETYPVRYRLKKGEFLSDIIYADEINDLNEVTISEKEYQHLLKTQCNCATN